MKKIFAAVLLILTGCATPTPLPQLEEIRLPETGLETSAELGDTMVQYVIAAIRPSWKLLQPYQSINGVITPAGAVLTPFGSDETYESFAEGGLCRHKVTGAWCVGQTAFGDCNALTCSVGSREISAVRADWIDTSTRNIDQQLIYNGRVGSNVKFTYREFTATGYARDAFTQDVQYDLEEGTIIGFKGARIEVLDATNRSIRYRVIEHFPPL
ncbi:hypothetical protein EYZ66_02535 [Aequoribacter fuscus]|jgi:hypothetical protein|uniref:hypothetical protein n=1 Tax=Aequoribacter fuscus TaxID=2518989 RepID=UPI0011120377|nr:hypothetical protein [Aequoribacter fuscus]QHJ87241.1 hypothetical protein EYZ66_02535 [Aequoribacter fuscus]